MSLISFDEASEALLRGEVGILPTDTVYGVVARASDEAAVKRLYNVKHRERKPGTVIAASIDQLVELGIKRRYLVPVMEYWPAPLSIVVPAEPQHAYLHLGKQSLAVRIPDEPSLQTLLKRIGPLLTSSANHPGEPTAVTLEQAKGYFNDEVDFYVDGGDRSGAAPSTIIRVVDDAIEVLRQGAMILKDV